MPIDVTVKGHIEARNKLLQVARDLRGDEFVDAMQTATLMVERDAKLLAPVDTGRLRASITGEVRVEGNSVQGVVGSNVLYAPYMELGTRPHFPPVRALAVWARRHGMNAFLVARAISVRGTKPREFLQRAFEQNRVRIVAMLGDAVGRIVRK